MEIPISSLITVILAVVGFLFGAVWGHHGEIAKKVSYDACSQNRQKCPCVKEIEELKKKIVSPTG